MPQPSTIWTGGGGLVRQLLHSVGDLVRALQLVQHFVATSQQHPRGHGDWTTELKDLQQMADALPAGWYRAAALLLQRQPRRNQLGQRCL